MGVSEWADDIIQELIDRLEEGESMRSICKDKRLPDRRTIERWAKGDDELAANIVRAREVGYHARAEKAVEDAKSATDAALGRLAFDAERWHLSKLSRAFAEKTQHEHTGKDGEPIKTQSETRLNVEGLTDEQLRVLASIRVSAE